MPRIASGWHLKRRSSSPYWYVYFTLNGQEILRSTGVLLGNEQKAREEAAAIVHRAASERQPTGRGGAVLSAQLAAQLDLDLKALSTQWIEEMEEHGKDPKSVARIETDMLNYVEKIWQYPRDVTIDSWNEAKRELHSKPQLRGKPLSWRSIAHLKNTLMHFLRWCHAGRVIASVPELESPTIKQQKAERAARSHLDEEQREAFLWALAMMGEGRALRIYTTLFETWMRKGSLEAMTPRWCSFRDETITLPPQFNKSRKEKTIDMTPLATEAIRAEMDERGEVVSLDEPIFGPFDFHQAWDAEKKGGLFGRALTLAGIDRHGLTAHHSTRHTALTQAGQSPEATISGMMAQAGIDSATIVEIYMKPQLKAARQITRAKTRRLTR